MEGGSGDRVTGSDGEADEEDEGVGGLLADLFGHDDEEEEATGVDLLIAALPDYSIQEVLEEATRLEAQMRQWRQR
jgi:hypothetical protein